MIYQQGGDVFYHLNTAKDPADAAAREVLA
jgi:hypothetical protein